MFSTRATRKENRGRLEAVHALAVRDKK